MKTSAAPFRAAALVAVAVLLAAAPRSGAATVPLGAKGYVPSDDGKLTVVDLSTMSVLKTLDVGSQPRGLDATPAQDFVWVANSVGTLAGGINYEPSVSVIDTATDEVVQTVILSKATPYDCAVAPDGSTVYVPCTNSGFGDCYVSVIDAASRTETTTVQLASYYGDPESLAVSPDGSKVYVACRGALALEVIDTATNTLVGSPVTVNPSPRDVAFNAAGTKAILVGDFGPTFIDVATDTRTATDLPDMGSQRHVVVVGNLAYVTNLNYSPITPTAKPDMGGPSIDVYDLGTETYVTSFVPGVGQPYGIDAFADGSLLFVTSKNEFLLGAVDPTTEEPYLAPAATGDTSRGVAVVRPKVEVQVDSYFLPRSLNLRLVSGAGDSIGGSGFYDDGGATVDYTKPVTLEVGGFARTFTLEPKKAGFVAPKAAGVKFSVTPNLKGSSRGKFKLKIAATELDGLVAADAPVTLHFRADGMPDCSGRVTLTSGRYRLGKARGALLSPPFYPQRGVATLSATGPDKLSFRGGFATNGTTPAVLGDVTFGFGTYTRTVPGDAFTRKGDVFRFTETVGAQKTKVTVDYLRELMTVSLAGFELGDLAGPSADVVFDAGSGANSVRVTIRLGTSGKKRAY